MTSIPVTAKEFEAWSAEHKAEWPPELQALAGQAQFILNIFAMNPPSQLQAAEKFEPNAWASWARDLMNFAEAYGRWKEFRSGER